MNVIMYAYEARVDLAVTPGEVRITVDDRGPGIADIELALTEGYSTATAEMRELGFGAGMGLPNMFPPLVGSDWPKAKKPDRLIRMILHGVMGPIKVNGQPFNTPAPMMPGQAAMLSDQQIADVLTFVRAEFGGGASEVTPDQVKAIREAEKARATMWTEAELEKIPVE
jgi:hypothetical protein